MLVLQVTNSPFTQEQAELLNRILPTLSDTQRLWLNGYLTALQLAATPTAAASAAPPTLPLSPVTDGTLPVISKEVTILFGSQTGNSHKLAKKMTSKLEEQGYQTTLSSMSDFKPNNLKKLHSLLIVVSTHGEGDPPDSAISFYEFLHSKRAPELKELRYSVLALGDTSYEFFCKTGKDFDSRLEELGAKQLTARTDCDVDYEDAAGEWMAQVIKALNEAASGSAAPVGVIASAAKGSDAESEYSRSNPFAAEVLENINLNGRGSKRETRHVEISLEGSNLQYEPGDCLGIYAENDPRLVDEIIAAMGWTAEEQVTVNKSGDKRSVREALLQNFEITVLTKPLIESLAALSSDDSLKKLASAGNEAELRSYAKGKDLLDLIGDFSLKGIGAEQLVSKLRKLPPRLYSISSSPTAYPDEVHVTVRSVRYESAGRERYGVCSVHLAERVEAGDKLPVFIQQNENFKLPQNTETPIIMIGPGTGVAPFRAFLGELEELGAEGRTWLFYGDQYFSTDFLYQVEWQRWLETGVLTRMDVAFSRDTDKKIYVQHRMLEKSKELYEWLQAGAHVYVCGDEKHMAHDVHTALLTILQQEGGLSEAAAAQYLSDMQDQRRYQRDVY